MNRTSENHEIANKIFRRALYQVGSTTETFTQTFVLAYRRSKLHHRPRTSTTEIKISLGRSAASTAYGNLSKTNIVFTLICIRSKDFFFLSHRQYPKFLESSETPVTPCRVLISSHLSTLIFLKSCFYLCTTDAR